MEILQAWDEAIVLWVRNHMSCTFLDVIARGISKLGDKGLIWIVLAIGLVVLGVRKRNGWDKWGILFLVCLSVNSFFVNSLIKPWVGRARPYQHMGLDSLGGQLHDFSFPSGHTSAAFVAVAIGYGIHKTLGRCMLIFAFCMAFSRLYLGVHYPSDIIAGALIGFGCAYFIICFVGYVESKVNKLRQRK